MQSFSGILHIPIVSYHSVTTPGVGVYVKVTFASMCFSLAFSLPILKYMGDYPTKHARYPLELTDQIFGPAAQLEDLRDEVYCQILKQMTDNSNRFVWGQHFKMLIHDIAISSKTRCELKKPYSNNMRILLPKYRGFILSAPCNLTEKILYNNSFISFRILNFTFPGSIKTIICVSKESELDKMGKKWTVSSFFVTGPQYMHLQLSLQV